LVSSRCHGADLQKKAFRAAEQDRPDVKAAREQWRSIQGSWDARQLVFLDETGVNTKMARLYGRAPRAQRCVGVEPHGHWSTSTFIAALRHDGLTAPWLLDGPMNKAAFTTYLQECLGPTLRPGDIVIADNLSSHKGTHIPAILARFGATILYLPPYSPDLNPIELLFAKLKAHLREAASRSLLSLTENLASILDLFSPELCRNFLRHCSYSPS
jgi:transposase